jgi:hypothetical protein
MENWIPILPQIITSGATAVATILAVVITNGGKIKALNKKLDSMYAELLRLAFHDDKASIEERIDAGYKYIQLGGNGSTRADYELLVEKYKGKPPAHNRRKDDRK